MAYVRWMFARYLPGGDSGTIVHADGFAAAGDARAVLWLSSRAWS